MSLLACPTYTLSQKTKAVELTGEYTLRDEHGQQIGTVVETGHGAAHKALRAITGQDSFLKRNLEIRDMTGAVVATVARNRGVWREIVTVTDSRGATVGQVKVRLLAPSLPLPMGHPVVSESGEKIGVVRTHGLRRRRFTMQLRGADVAAATQDWGGVLREAFTQADRFTFRRTAAVDAALLPLVFALPLVVELSFKQGGGVSPLGEALSLLG